MKYFSALIAFIVLGYGLFFVYSYYHSQSLLLVYDQTYAVHSFEQMLRIVLWFGVALAFALSLLLYLALTLHTTARMIAFSLTKDIAFSRDRLRRFYELSPVPYLLVNKDGYIKRPNKASLRFFGVSEEELLNKQLFDFFKLPDQVESFSLYREKMKRGISLEQKEMQVHTLDGVLRWVLFSAENLDEPHAQESQVLVTLVDIHEQKELERIKTEFLSLASHQLRAPLANLKWYIDFLLKRRTASLTPEIAEYLNKMYRRNEEMIDLVNTLLNLSRVEMGRVKVEKQHTDMTALVRSVVEELETVAGDKKISLHVEVPDVLTFDTDGKLVRIVLQNLLTNALRYTNASGTVDLRMSGDAHAVVIEVADTGVGIPPEEQGRIFSKMYRATNAQSMEVNGNGIGLYMCKALTEALGGTIGFESALGRGTTFRIKL
ncbi:MAG: PAS domain-containing sensor histidine kinase [Candidatus Pacebacteria bacterium]|nr:PAS domain-containing sensor histidine kinase [Candidatus Paceibacterota bacterium]